MKETKRRIMTFTFYDRTGIERDLEAQAEKGWLLEKCAATGWVYRRIEPAKIHFSVVYLPTVSMFDPEPNEKQQRFQEFCEYTGWELIASNVQMQIFCNRREHPIPIETEPALEVENIHRSVKKTLLPTIAMNLIMPVIQLGLAFQRFSWNPLLELANWNALLSLFFWGLMFFSSGSQLVLYYSWLRKARAAAQDGHFLETRSTDRFQITVLISSCLALLFLMGSLGGWRMAMLGILLGASIGGSGILLAKLTEWMKKKNIRSNVNRLVTLGLAILVSIIVCGVFLWLMLGVILSGHDSRDRAEPYEYNNWTFYVYHDDIPLRIEDLVKTNYNGYSYEMITDSASPLLRYQEVRQRPRYDALAEPELEYRIAEVQVPWIYDYVQEQMLADFSHNYGYPEDDPNWEEHRSIDPTPWNAASAYQLVLSGEPMQRYLLCYEGSILEIDLDWIPTEAQMEIIYETLLP